MTSDTPVLFSFDGFELTASIGGGAAATDFLALLPLTLTLGDHAKTEKVADLPGRLAELRHGRPTQGKLVAALAR